MILLHPHAIGNLMVEPRSKAAKDAGELSETAKSYCLKLAKQHVYDFKTSLEKQKVIQKGLQCEQDCIDLINMVTNNFFVKNTLRIETDLFSGECDILDDDGVWDAKSAWSLETFPVLPEEAHSPLYEWQGRAYMHIYDRQHFTLAYGLVSTPDELCKYEDYRLHQVEHIDPAMRVTLWRCTRDMEKEALMLEKSRRAQVYIEQLIADIKDAHKF